MKAFVIKLEALFKFDTGISTHNFSTDKKKLVIPLYQREYKWENEKIENLISDINNRSKFLGNIIIDELDNRYEIVDGQQRITTLYLILISLYNTYYGSPLEQQSINKLIKPYENKLLLENNSIGNYISEENNKMFLTIDDENDVYFQEKDFNRVFGLISHLIESLKQNSDVREFKRKLLDCQVLILINEEHNNAGPVEQIYLDINEKAQLLEGEDIFKGHCFENCTDDFREHFKNLWVDLKKEGMQFTENFSYKDLSEFIYHYLLEKENNTLSENLKINKKHYLERKTMDETAALLNEMIKYGKSINDLYKKLHVSNYKFGDICQDSIRYKNTNDHINLKSMLCDVFEYDKSLFQKIPMFVWVNTIQSNGFLQANLKHEDFKKIITNLYIYAMLFTFKKSKKSKKDIDYTIRNSLSLVPMDISKIVSSAKVLRANIVNEFELSNNNGFAFLSFIYSIMDTYTPNTNWIKAIYSNKAYGMAYNLEHFIIPDNRNCTIDWISEQCTCKISLPKGTGKVYKKKLINYLIIDIHLNEEIKSQDIVTKIQIIKKWFINLNLSIPNHVQLFINEIEKMNEYQCLQELKFHDNNQEQVSNLYSKFIDAYFDDEHQEQMKIKIQEAFKNSFQN